MKVIDLFSGCGGLSYGFIKDGFRIEKAVEFDSSIANTYIMNHPKVDMIVDDIQNIDQAGVFKQGDADVIIGAPPCQGFSMAGARIRTGFIDDPRNYLFKHYFNVVKTVKPKIFIMENVKGIMTMQGGKIFDEILRIFSDEELEQLDDYIVYFTNTAGETYPIAVDITEAPVIKDSDLNMKDPCYGVVSSSKYQTNAADFIRYVFNMKTS